MRSKKYEIKRDTSLDFSGETYSDVFPNLHRYPATMIPQLGIELLKRFSISDGIMLDPYCGSGSSFAAGLGVGLRKFFGNDLNPLAVLISSVKFTKINKKLLNSELNNVRSQICTRKNLSSDFNRSVNITNAEFWFSKDVFKELLRIRAIIGSIPDEAIRNLVTLAFSETIRDSSFTRNNEFKLYRMPSQQLERHNPDVRRIFLVHLDRIASIYLEKYYPHLKGVDLSLSNSSFTRSKRKFDVVLTSPPYGDSRTTVAYGQFSTLTNEWLGIEDARKIDSRLMGGRRSEHLLNDGVLAKQIRAIAKIDFKRALEVSSFYEDLGKSISDVAGAVTDGGFAIYVVGNRRVKDVQLKTDQFIAESFENEGFEHLITFERTISSKSMPSLNSPSNVAKAVRGTMTQEFVVVCTK